MKQGHFFDILFLQIVRQKVDIWVVFFKSYRIRNIDVLMVNNKDKHKDNDKGNFEYKDKDNDEDCLCSCVMVG